MPGDVVTVTSGKGGVGKTTTAVNLAVALRQRGHSVAVVDADLGMPNVADVFGVESERTVHDVLADEAGVDDALVELAEGIAVLVGDSSLERFADADPDGLDAVVEALAERYRYVVVDTGGGLNYEGVLPMEFADEVLLVTSPDPAAVGDTAKSEALANRLEIPVRGVVVTHVTEDDEPEAVADELGETHLGSVPLERAVGESTADGTPVAAYAPDSRAAAAYDGIAATLADDGEASLDQLESAARAPDEDEPASSDTGAPGPAEAASDESDSAGESTQEEAKHAEEPATAGEDAGKTGATASGNRADEETSPSSTSGGFFSRLAGIFR